MGQLILEEILEAVVKALFSLLVLLCRGLWMLITWPWRMARRQSKTRPPED